jgi:hypothetical protein
MRPGRIVAGVAAGAVLGLLFSLVARFTGGT